jgi:hypothetical protein
LCGRKVGWSVGREGREEGNKNKRKKERMDGWMDGWKRGWKEARCCELGVWEARVRMYVRGGAAVSHLQGELCGANQKGHEKSTANCVVPIKRGGVTKYEPIHKLHCFFF